MAKGIERCYCFILRFENGLLGVTADHVVVAFETASTKNPNIVCQLRTSLAFDLLAAVIDRDSVRDIATFRVSEELVAEIGAVAVDCRNSWPPPKPDNMHALSVCGFPEALRTTTAHRTAEFGAWGALAAVEDTTDRDILITYDPARDLPSRWAPVLPPLGMNLSGCSGGPVLMHGERNGLHRWFPVGIITRGPKDAGTDADIGAVAEFDMIRLRRIHVIRPDGTIEKQAPGWLPS